MANRCLSLSLSLSVYLSFYFSFSLRSFHNFFVCRFIRYFLSFRNGPFKKVDFLSIFLGVIDYFFSTAGQGKGRRIVHSWVNKKQVFLGFVPHSFRVGLTKKKWKK